MITLKSKTLGILILLCVSATSAIILAGDNEAKPFKDMDYKEKIKLFNDEISRHQTNMAEWIKYFEQNWDQEDKEYRERCLVSNEKDSLIEHFCRLIGTYRTVEAIPLLSKKFDFFPVGDRASRLAPVFQDHVALKALVQIGVPALEPTAELIFSELGILGDGDDNNPRSRLLREALKYLTIEILGEKLAVHFLEDKLNSKETSPLLQKRISKVIEEIKRGEIYYVNPKRKRK